jgi:hypothetical protein
VSANMVRSKLDRILEGAKLMGYVEFIRPDGSKKTIGYDGKVTETSRLEMDFCDKCQKWQPKEFGRYEGSDGILLLWFCMDCK